MIIMNTRNLPHEVNQALKHLRLDVSNSQDIPNVRALRQHLRDLEFDKWCNLAQKGRGVILFKEFTPANTWFGNPKGLTSNEWKTSIKMMANVCPVRALPGRSLDGNHCRHCLSEKETLAHVLGACPHGELLRNTRHHHIRSMIADALRNTCQVAEEVHGIADEGSCRRIDILAIPNGSSDGFIIDPTVRMECDSNQPINVHNEKCLIYEPTIPYYKSKYNLTSIRIFGLLIGARGTIPKQFVEFCREFGLPNNFIKDVALAAIKGSIKILSNHLYSK